MEREDDDALAWDGDDDPTLAAPQRAEPLPDGYAAVGRGAAEFERDAAATPAEAEPQPGGMSNAALLALGVFGGIYLLYVVGWVIGGIRLEGTAVFLVSPVAYQAGLWLAVLAPAIWFGAVYFLTRSSRSWVRMVWLVAGAALLIPWPFIMTGAIGMTGAMAS